MEAKIFASSLESQDNREVPNPPDFIPVILANKCTQFSSHFAMMFLKRTEFLHFANLLRHSMMMDL